MSNPTYVWVLWSEGITDRDCTGLLSVFATAEAALTVIESDMDNIAKDDPDWKRPEREEYPISKEDQTIHAYAWDECDWIIRLDRREVQS